jgi:hypothetical protein
VADSNSSVTMDIINKIYELIDPPSVVDDADWIPEVYPMAYLKLVLRLILLVLKRLLVLILPLVSALVSRIPWYSTLELVMVQHARDLSFYSHRPRLHPINAVSITSSTSSTETSTETSTNSIE